MYSIALETNGHLNTTNNPLYHMALNHQHRKCVYVPGINVGLLDLCFSKCHDRREAASKANTRETIPHARIQSIVTGWHDDK
jgi:hypothetical protein